jgi:phosphonate transport system permease protein
VQEAPCVEERDVEAHIRGFCRLKGVQGPPCLDVKRDSFVLGACLLIMVVLLADLGFFDLQRLSRGLENVTILAQDAFPADEAVLDQVLRALWETIKMAVGGTLLGFFLSLPLGLLGTSSLWPWTVVAPVRLVVAVTRTIPSLVWAILFVIVVGLGPLAGTLGIAVYTLGYLAKLYSEFYDGVDPEVLEAVRGTGASKLQLARFVLWPETANSVISQLLFMVEYNIRASSILGFVGAGGIGFYVQVYVQTLQYQRLLTVLICLLAVVLALDAFSAWVRRRYQLSS